MPIKEKHSPGSVEALLNFRLWKLSSLSTAPVTRLCEGRYGVTRREWSVLAMTVANGPMTPLAISDRGSLDRTRVSRTIAALVGKGLLDKTVTRTGRTMRVCASDKGLDAYREIQPQVADVNARVLAALQPDEQQQFIGFLERLTEQAASVNATCALDVRSRRHKGGTRHVW
jgi:DNA-binding MarR family transcriptional regulator